MQLQTGSEELAAKPLGAVGPFQLKESLFNALKEWKEVSGKTYSLGSP